MSGSVDTVKQLDSVCDETVTSGSATISPDSVSNEESSKANDDEDRDSDKNEDTQENTKAPQYKRFLRRRSSSDSVLKKTANKTIKRPEKRSKDKNTMNSSDIKRLYLKQTLKNFKPSNLETIFENVEEEAEEEQEPDSSTDYILNESLEKSSPIAAANKNPLSPAFGPKKVKRLLKFNDCRQLNKNVIKKRRMKIRRHLGKKRPFKKIPLREFLSKLNQYSDECSKEETIQVQSPNLESTDAAKPTENETDDAGGQSSETKSEKTAEQSEDVASDSKPEQENIKTVNETTN